MTEGRTSEVPGYGYGATDAAHPPLGIEGLDLLEQTAREVGGTHGGRGGHELPLASIAPSAVESNRDREYDVWQELRALE